MKRFILMGIGVYLCFPLLAQADRQVVWLNASQKVAFLGEMRTFMSASQEILEASLADNMPKVEAAARNVGLQMVRNTPASLKARLPKQMMVLGPATHQAFEEIANEAETLGDKEMILTKLAKLQQNCVACHQTYQIKVAPHKTP